MLSTKQDVVRYVYTVGVMISGVFLAELTGGFERPSFWVALSVLGFGWLVYYDRVLRPRFEYFADREEAGTNGN